MVYKITFSAVAILLCTQYKLKYRQPATAIRLHVCCIRKDKGF